MVDLWCFLGGRIRRDATRHGDVRRELAEVRFHARVNLALDSASKFTTQGIEAETAPSG